MLNLHSFHNQLKTVHLNGKVNRRVDYLLHHLLQYEKDVFFNYQRTRQLPSAASSKMRKEANRHDRGLQIPASDVQVRVILKYSYRVFNKHLANLLCVHVGSE